MNNLEQIKKEFIENVMEIAFGDNAINRDFTQQEVLDKLRGHSDNALKWEEAEDDLVALCEDNEVMVECIKEYFR